MNINALVKAQIDGRLIRMSWLVRLATEEPVRVWFGIGDIEHGIDAVETEGGIYKGIGTLLEMPPLQQLTNGTAERIDLSMSGVSAEIVALADADAPEVRSKRVDIGIMFFDEDWQPLSDTMWVWSGEADVIKTSSQSSADFTRTRTVTLSIGSDLTGRRRPKLSYWTRAQQRRRSPDDAFCDRTAIYSQGSSIKWPP